MNKIAIDYTEPCLAAEARTLAQQLQLPLKQAEECYKVILQLSSNGYALIPNFDDFNKPITCDFSQPMISQRRQQKPQTQLLVKAMGKKPLRNSHIIDATAGFGGDAYVLASLGANMTLLERSPIIALLLAEAIKKISDHDPIKAKLTLIEQDSCHYLKTQQADIVYLDPMYPPRTKSALNKKLMRTLNIIVGQDEDAAQLFSLATTAAKRRVVVKRPKLGQFLVEQKPDYSLTGRASRFDIYLTQR